MSTTAPSRTWAVPVLSVLIGAALLAAAASQGQLALGLAMLGVMLGYAAILVIFRRSEPVAMLAEESTDERRRQLQLRAGYFSLAMVALFVTGGLLVDLLRGGDGLPWALVGLVGGVSFIAALAVLSRRG